jgi:hypothetical protein
MQEWLDRVRAKPRIATSVSSADLIRERRGSP